MNNSKKTMPEIRADVETILSEIIGECYIMRDDLVDKQTIRSVHFKTFLIDQANKIIEEQKNLNKIL